MLVQINDDEILLAIWLLWVSQLDISSTGEDLSPESRHENLSRKYWDYLMKNGGRIEHYLCKTNIDIKQYFVKDSMRAKDDEYIVVHFHGMKSEIRMNFPDSGLLLINFTHFSNLVISPVSNIWRKYLRATFTAIKMMAQAKTFCQVQQVVTTSKTSK